MSATLISGAPSPSPPPEPPPDAPPPPPYLANGRDLRFGLGLAFVLVGLSVIGGPAQASGRAVIVNAAAVVLGLATVAFGRSRPGLTSFAGQWSVALFAAFLALSGFSITWSVDPASTWQEVNRLLGYLAVFTGAVIAARTFPVRWRTVVFGLAVASVAMSALALLTKVSPELLAPDETYARLREPLQYWNAVGLIGAFGVPLWLYYGTRRTGRPILDILAAPALVILFVTIMLSYSRGSLIAAIAGALVWLAFAPLRLRSVATLVAPLVGAAIIILWAFGQSDLTTDDVDLLLRETAGHRFGVVIFVTLALVTLLSLVTQFLIAARAPSTSWRKRAGIVLLGGALLVPVGGAAALTQSERGFSGTISNAWTQLTDPAASQVAGSQPANSPQRLATAANARSVYWRDAFRVTKAHPVIGAGANGYGAARLRYRSDNFAVGHAHGFLVQTAADLGLVGLALALMLFGAWCIAVGRTIGGRRQPWPPERLGMVALLAAVVAFGVHSSIDWTWSFAAATLPALVAAGWLAGRGSVRTQGIASAPTLRPTTENRWVLGFGRWVPRLQLTAFVLLALWSIVTPYRAFKASQDAFAALSAGDVETAVKESEHAVSLDPVSLDTHATQAAALAAGGDLTGARAAIEDGVSRQPENPAAWLQLVNFELGTAGDAERAAAAYRVAIFLDPYSSTLRNLITQALTPPAPAAADPAPSDPASGATAPADPGATGGDAGAAGDAGDAGDQGSGGDAGSGDQGSTGDAGGGARASADSVVPEGVPDPNTAEGRKALLDLLGKAAQAQEQGGG